MFFCLVSLIAQIHNATVSLNRSLASYCPFHVFLSAGFGWIGEDSGYVPYQFNGSSVCDIVA